MDRQDIVQVSPSQLDLFQKCPRAWHLDKVEGRVEDQEAAPEYRKQGRRIHEVLEWYLRTGRIVTPAEYELVNGPGTWVKDHHGKGVNLLRKALSKGHLPVVTQDVKELEEALGTGKAAFLPSEILVETRIEEPVIYNPDGSVAAWLLGYADLIWEDEHWDNDGSMVFVDDHKTISDLDRAKTPTQLLSDIQLNAYAEHVFRAAGSRDVRQTLRHVYYETKNKIKVDTHEVAAPTTAEHVASVWEGKVIPITREIIQLHRAKPPALEVEGRGALNGHCNAYGGCRHREFCGINKVSSFSGFPTGGNMSDPAKNPLMARLMAAGKTPTTPPPSGDAPAAPPPAAPAPAAGPVTGTLARLAAKGAGQPALGIPAAAAVSAERGEEPHGGGLAGNGTLGKTTAHTVADLAILEAEAAGLLPGDAPPREEPAPAPPAEFTQSISVTTAPARRTRSTAAPAVNCPACRKPVKLDKEGRISDHYGVDASMRPDKMAPCVLAGDTMEDATAWMTKRHEAAHVNDTPHPDAPRSLAEAVLGVKVPDSGEIVHGDTIRIRELEAAVAGAADRIEELERYTKNGDAIIARLEGDLKAAADLVAKQSAELDEARSTVAATLARATAAGPPTPGLTLWLDTWPYRGETKPDSFEAWIAPVMAKAAEVGGVPDYQLIEYKSGAVLAVTLRDMLAKDEIKIPGALAVNTKHRAWGVASEILLPVAKRIVKPSY